ncbi:hypothetical protein Dda_5026 [Drechslerella dactyloides]|uniref:Uncharacterized protein n=1 Tax=Drechslerella dactyloides TaxID=74499 RepID=A0AAD6IYF9_DREDA|nr:hypothetical protein Dda_5026 [Drechslerella dactyloides]
MDNWLATFFRGASAPLLFPFGPHLIDLHLVVLCRVVLLSDAHPSLPGTQVLVMDGDTAVLISTTLADVPPSPLLLCKIQASGIRQPDISHDGTGKTEPWDDVKLGLGVDIAVENGSRNRTKLTNGSAESMSRSADGRRVDFSGDKESNRVRAELVEERGHEIHCLEGMDVFPRCEVVKRERRNDEKDEIEHEADDLHPFSAVELVVDEERGKVVANQRNGDVDKIPFPALHDGMVIRSDDLDEF